MRLRRVSSFARLALVAAIVACGPASAAVPAELPPSAVAAQRPVPAVDASAALAEAAIAEPVVTPKAALAKSDVGEMKHVWQSLNNCGPAAVVMALSTLGVDASQEDARLALRGPDVNRGMGPAGVGPWVEQFGLRSMWRNNGTNALLKKLVSNGFAPMVTQWMVDPHVSRVSHWRTVRGYDDARGAFLVNDSMLGRDVALTYDRFAGYWQTFSYRYMVIYRPADEALLKAIVGADWSDKTMRQAYFDRARNEAIEQDTSSAWLAFGEAAYQYGMFEESVAAIERGLALGSATGVFMLRSSYPNALRALGRHAEADAARAKLAGLTPGVSPASGPQSTTIDPVIAALVAERERTMLAAREETAATTLLLTR
jgi:hypothetical protein